LIFSVGDESDIEPFWTSGSYKNGKYKWLATGRDFGYINLAPPRSQQRSHGGGIDASCVGMASVKNETAWIGAPCEQMNRFVCEKPSQLAFKDHFLYEQMRREEEEELNAASSTEAPAEAATEQTPSPEDEKFNEVVRRRG